MTSSPPSRPNRAAAFGWSTRASSRRPTVGSHRHGAGNWEQWYCIGATGGNPSHITITTTSGNPFYVDFLMFGGIRSYVSSTTPTSGTSSRPAAITDSPSAGDLIVAGARWSAGPGTPPASPWQLSSQGIWVDSGQIAYQTAAASGSVSASWGLSAPWVWEVVDGIYAPAPAPVVSGIAINGTLTGVTSGQFVVPNGGSITLYYTEPPQWNWWLF